MKALVSVDLGPHHDVDVGSAVSQVGPGEKKMR